MCGHTCRPLSPGLSFLHTTALVLHLSQQESAFVWLLAMLCTTCVLDLPRPLGRSSPGGAFKILQLRTIPSFCLRSPMRRISFDPLLARVVMTSTSAFLTRVPTVISAHHSSSKIATFPFTCCPIIYFVRIQRSEENPFSEPHQWSVPLSSSQLLVGSSPMVFAWESAQAKCRMSTQPSQNRMSVVQLS